MESGVGISKYSLLVIEDVVEEVVLKVFARQGFRIHVFDCKCLAMNELRAGNDGTLL